MEENNSKLMRSEILLNKIKSVVQTLDEIDEMINTQATELSKVDSELSDWYHLIENRELTKEEGYKIIERIHELRVIRRGLNNEHELENTYQTHKSKLTGNETRQFLLNEMCKTEKRLNQEYKNRVLTDEMILEVLDEKPKKKRGRPKKIVEQEIKTDEETNNRTD